MSCAMMDTQILTCGSLAMRRSSRMVYCRPLHKVCPLYSYASSSEVFLDVLSICFVVAQQKAKYMVKVLNRLAKGQKADKPFQFHNQGMLAYLGDWCVIYKDFFVRAQALGAMCVVIWKSAHYYVSGGRSTIGRTSSRARREKMPGSYMLSSPLPLGFWMC